MFYTAHVQSQCTVHVQKLIIACSIFAQFLGDPSSLPVTHAHVLYICIEGGRSYKVSRNVKQG